MGNKSSLKTDAGAPAINQAGMVQGLIDAIQIPLYFRTADRKCLWCNTSFEKLIGFGKETIVGADVDAVLFADDLGAMEMLDEVLFTLGGEQNFETTIRNAQNGSAAVNVSRMLYTGAVTGIQGIVAGLVDVTYRHQVEKSVNRAVAILNGVLESAHDGFLAVQRFEDENKVVASNKSLALMFGFAENFECNFAGLKQLADQVAIPADYWTRFLSQVADSENMIHEVLGLKSGPIFDVYSKPFYHGSEIAGRVWNYRDITDARLTQARLEESNERNQRLSLIDGLTGLSNRRHFDEVFEKEWRRALRSGDTLSVLFFDIDFFKKYNDHYGHLEGDDCIRDVARVLRDSIGAERRLCSAVRGGRIRGGFTLDPGRRRCRHRRKAAAKR